jgi:hypothetical protein
MLNLIRSEKFDIILPIVMRANDIDMWIHVMREGNPDPLSIDLGGEYGYFIFTDLDKERIERVVLGGNEEELQLLKVYDEFGGKEDLIEFVSKRDPKRIAINMSDWISVADGLSHTEYLKLIKKLGDKFKERLTSAGPLITDFRTRRVTSEIIVFGQLAETTRRLLERALSREVITPGITTLEDIGWWMKDQLLIQGMKSTFGLSLPSVIHSFVSNETQYQARNYIIQKGDLIQYDYGISHMNFGTDFKRFVYVLRNGESQVPKEIQFGWNQALEARKIIRQQIKIGQTAGETLLNIGIALDQANFEYVHIDLDPMLGGGPNTDADDNLEKTQVIVDCHCVGNTGNSEVASGPSIAGFRKDRAHLVIKSNNLFAFEFIAFTPLPEWGGKKIRFNMEDNAVVTENGVEWLYPPNENILLIN